MRWLAVLWLLLLPVVSQAQPVRVFAAASLTDGLEAAGKQFTAATGVKVAFSFASTATLARQIEQGAPADLFIAADESWMAYLVDRQRVAASSVRILAGNRLVLVAPAAARLRHYRLDSALPLAQLLGPAGRLVLADPASVPAGRYGEEALRALGLWPQVAHRIARADNVRSALMFVARGQAPLGIVYATDARAEPKVSVVGRFPASSHAPIRYPAALTAAHRPQAVRFLAYLASPAGQTVLRQRGFLPPR